jgi:hypothetical protein
MSKPIIVLGAPRTGTSLMSRILSRWGAYAGEERLMATADAWNPEGYWEYGPLVRFHLDLHQSTGVTPLHDEFDALLRQRAASSSWRTRALDLVSHMDQQAMIWFWKYPLYVLSIPFWETVITDAVYVVTVRSPWEAAVSSEKFNVPSELKHELKTLPGLLALWQHYMIKIIDHVAPSQDTIFVAYEKVVEDPHTECHRLCEFLDTRLGSEADRGARIDAMASCPKKSLQHNADTPARPLVTAEQNRLYDILLNRCKDAGLPVDTGPYALSPMMREYLNTLLVLRRYQRRVEANERTLSSRTVRTALALNRALRRLSPRS